MSFRIHLDGCNLEVDGVWPDGDAPERPTALDVARRIADYGVDRAVRDWDLLTGICVTDGRGGIVDIDEFDRIRDRSTQQTERS